ncbi:MAG: 1-acyl-sn-glycerol-3-phosphate acyltransferase [Clostridia bacterium]|nr:1-acyl-sn-glycerol-3-phosphate acyltransferase [Clostridia bacterium]
MLTALFSALALIPSVLLCALSPAVSFWWLFPLWVGFYFAIALFYLLGIFASTLFFSKKQPDHPNKNCITVIHVTMRWLMSLMRVKVRTKGEEIIPSEPVVFVSNHLSDFDPLTTFAALNRKIIYISKESNFKIPFVGRFIRRAGFLAIDRENGMRALRTLKRAADMMSADGVDVGIYPEGTRSRTGELLEFKSGAFYLAKKANVPIVIMTTKNSELVAKNAVLRKTVVELDFLEVMSAEQVKALSVDEICAYVRQKIAEHLGKD